MGGAEAVRPSGGNARRHWKRRRYRARPPYASHRTGPPRGPVALGCPRSWPVFFPCEPASRLEPSFDVQGRVVSRYPDEEKQVASGWLLGDELLRNQANGVWFPGGKGTGVTLGSQVDFRTQTPARF